MNASPKISVLLPVFDGAKTIGRAIESVLDQTFAAFELLIIDNGSTDQTADIVHSYSDERIKYFKLEKPNLVEALNFGLGKSIAPIIARMDADDFSFPRRFELQYDYLKQHPNIGLVSGLVAYEGQSLSNQGYVHYVNSINQIVTSAQIFNNRFRESSLPHPSIMFRKILEQMHGGYELGNIPEDFELYLRWMDAGVKMSKVHEVILKWSDSPGRLSRIDSNYEQEAFAKIKAKYFAMWYKRTFPNWRQMQLIVWGNSKIVKRKIKFLIREGLQIKFFVDVKAHPEDHIIQHSDLLALKDVFILNYVSDRKGKKKVEQYLLDLGYLPGKQFYMME